MGQEHDDWFKGALGIDLDQVRKAAGGAGGGVPPSPDPAFQTAVADTAIDFTKGFVKGVSDTAASIVNSPSGQIVAGPLGFEANVLNAAITGDPSKLAPTTLEIPDTNDPNQQAKALAEAKGLVKSVVDPVGFQKDAAVATATVLVTGDPEQVGEATGKATVIIGTTVLGGIGELGVAGEAGAAGESGAAGTAGLPPEAPPVVDPALDAPASAGVPEAPPSSVDPNAGPFGRPDGPEFGPDFRPPPDLPPVSAPTSGPVTPRIGDAPAPVSGFDPALQNLPADPAPASGPDIDLTPPSRLPGLDDPPPAPPPGEGPGFPFGVDPPSAPPPEDP